MSDLDANLRIAEKGLRLFGPSGVPVMASFNWLTCLHWLNELDHTSGELIPWGFVLFCTIVLLVSHLKCTRY